ncbi:MAG: cell division protein FtsZ [archaeon]|jgi:cell division protein FtsZ|nr:cell division protein FtsZ [archaeon]
MAKKKAPTKKNPVKAVKKPAKKVQAKKTPPQKVIVKKQEAETEDAPRTRVRVIGLGGGGGTIVAEIAQRIRRVDFLAANTDVQALREVPRGVKTFAFGQELTNGLGCGMDPAIGEKAAEGEREKIKRLFEDQDVTILVASLGGGTGSGALPLFAELAKESKNLTIGIFTMPFAFEGDRRKQIAEQALEEAKGHLNTYAVIPNERIFQLIDKQTSLKSALSEVNRLLADSIEGLIDTISSPGLINIDFADLKSVLEGRGRLAYLYSVMAQGPTKAQEAVAQVLANPLCAYSIEGVDRMLFNVAGDKGLRMQEVASISAAISKYNPKARIILGVTTNGGLKGRIRITLFTTGCKTDDQKLLRFRKRKTAKPKPQAKKAKKTSKAQKPRASKQAPPIEPEKAAPLAGEDNSSEVLFPVGKSRRNALDLQRAVDQEVQDLEQKEREWDPPAFLQNK